jgi:acyl-CoA thioesterase I
MVARSPQLPGGPAVALLQLRRMVAGPMTGSLAVRQRRSARASAARLPAAAATALAVALLAAGPALPASPAAASPAPARPAVRLLFVGASVTAGEYAAEPAHAYPELVAARLRADGYCTELRVVAHPGATAAAARRWDLRTPSDVVVVHLVTNDFSRDTRPASYQAAYEAVIRRLRQASPSGRLVCLGGWGDPRAVNRLGVRAERYDRIAQAACAAAGGRYVDVSALYLQHADRGPAGQVTALGVRDGFHPNDRGHRRLAAAVLAALHLPPADPPAQHAAEGGPAGRE